MYRYQQRQLLQRQQLEDEVEREKRERRMTISLPDSEKEVLEVQYQQQPSRLLNPTTYHLKHAVRGTEAPSPLSAKSSSSVYAVQQQQQQQQQMLMYQQQQQQQQLQMTDTVQLSSHSHAADGFTDPFMMSIGGNATDADFYETSDLGDTESLAMSSMASSPQPLVVSQDVSAFLDLDSMGMDTDSAHQQHLGNTGFSLSATGGGVMMTDGLTPEGAFNQFSNEHAMLIQEQQLQASFSYPGVSTNSMIDSIPVTGWAAPTTAALSIPGSVAPTLTATPTKSSSSRGRGKASAAAAAAAAAATAAITASSVIMTGGTPSSAPAGFGTQFNNNNNNKSPTAVPPATGSGRHSPASMSRSVSSSSLIFKTEVKAELDGAESSGSRRGSTTGMTPEEIWVQEKRRRRRESHNLVERRRRDNINDRIVELSMIVPDCAEDEQSSLKTNKGVVLRKSADYIRHLQEMNRQLMAQLQLQHGQGLDGQPFSLPNLSLSPMSSNAPIDLTNNGAGSGGDDFVTSPSGSEGY